MNVRRRVLSACRQGSDSNPQQIARSRDLVKALGFPRSATFPAKLLREGWDTRFPQNASQFRRCRKDKLRGFLAWSAPLHLCMTDQAGNGVAAVGCEPAVDISRTVTNYRDMALAMFKVPNAETHVEGAQFPTDLHWRAGGARPARPDFLHPIPKRDHSDRASNPRYPKCREAY